MVACDWIAIWINRCLHWVWLVFALFLETFCFWKGAQVPTSTFSLMSTTWFGGRNHNLQKIHTGLKLELNLNEKCLWSLKRLKFRVFYKHPFGVPWGVINVNTQWQISYHRYAPQVGEPCGSGAIRLTADIILGSNMAFILRGWQSHKEERPEALWINASHAMCEPTWYCRTNP